MNLYFVESQIEFDPLGIQKKSLFFTRYILTSTFKENENKAASDRQVLQIPRETFSHESHLTNQLNISCSSFFSVLKPTEKAELTINHQLFNGFNINPKYS